MLFLNESPKDFNNEDSDKQNSVSSRLEVSRTHPMLATKFISHSTVCDPSVSVFIFFGYFHVQLYFFSYRSRCSFAMVDSVLHWCYSLLF